MSLREKKNGERGKEEKLFMAHLPTYLVDRVLLCVQDALK